MEGSLARAASRPACCDDDAAAAEEEEKKQPRVRLSNALAEKPGWRQIG